MDSSSPKPPILPLLNPLTPSEIEAFRQEMKLVHAYLKVLAKQVREERVKSRADSLSAKPSLLPIANLLSPSEIESLRQEFNLAQDQLAILVAERRKNRGKSEAANPDESNT